MIKDLPLGSLNWTVIKSKLPFNGHQLDPNRIMMIWKNMKSNYLVRKIVIYHKPNLIKTIIKTIKIL